MKKTILALIILAGCNSGGGGGSSGSETFTLDSRLINATGEAWESYDAGTNIDDRLVIREATIGAETFIAMYLDSSYRGGSVIYDVDYELAATGASKASAYEVQVNGSSPGEFEAEYSFIDDDTLEVCFDASTCSTYLRTP